MATNFNITEEDYFCYKFVSIIGYWIEIRKSNLWRCQSVNESGEAFWIEGKKLNLVEKPICESEGYNFSIIGPWIENK